jgi:hypothetical protein
MVNRVHRPLKVIAFNANGILRQRYELSKELQDLHIDVALFSETHLKPHERFSIQNYHFYRNDRKPGRKGGTAVAVKNSIPHNHVDLLPLVSVEATGVCIPIGNTEIQVKVKVKVKVTLRLTVSQSVCLGVEPKYGTLTIHFFLKLQSCHLWGALSDERSGLSCVSLVFEVYSSQYLKKYYI